LAIGKIEAIHRQALPQGLTKHLRQDHFALLMGNLRQKVVHQPGEAAAPGTELEFVIMVIAVSCVKLLSAHNSTQHTSRKHKV
jgi:hypothetical protein